MESSFAAHVVTATDRYERLSRDIRDGFADNRCYVKEVESRIRDNHAETSICMSRLADLAGQVARNTETLSEMGEASEAGRVMKQNLSDRLDALTADLKWVKWIAGSVVAVVTFALGPLITAFEHVRHWLDSSSVGGKP